MYIYMDFVYIHTNAHKVKLRAVRLYDAILWSYLLMRSTRLFFLVKCNPSALLHPFTMQCCMSCVSCSNLYKMKLTVSQFALSCWTPLISIDSSAVLLDLFLWMTPNDAKVEVLLRSAPILRPAGPPDRFFSSSKALILYTRQEITQLKSCQRATECRYLQFSDSITFCVKKSTQNWTGETICQNSSQDQSGKVN